MGAESLAARHNRKQIKEQVDQDLEVLLEKKKPRLPRGLSKKIRDLKASGQQDEANIAYREAIEKKKPLRKEFIARIELYKKIDEIIESDEPHVQVERQIEAVWLMEASGLINDEQRRDNLMEIIEQSENTDLQPEVNRALITARDKLQNLLPSQD